MTALPSRSLSRRSTYPMVAVMMILVVFAGFAPTYYLRTTDAPPLSIALLAHGLLFTLWMGLFLAQTLLISTGRTELHRRLGWVAAVTAVAMVGSGLWVTLAILRGQPGGAEPGLVVFAMGPLSGLAAFALLVGWAIAMRRRSDWHSRLMTMGTVTLLGPALARMFTMAGGIFWLIGVNLAIVFALIAVDTATNRRPHPAYLWSGALVGLVLPILFIVVAQTGPWITFMGWVSTVGR